MNKRTLLSAYNALERQIEKSTKLFSEANAELDEMIKNDRFVINHEDTATIIVKACFNLSVTGNSLDIYFVNYDLPGQVANLPDSEKHTQQICRGYLCGDISIETLCGMVDPSLHLAQHVHVKLDNETLADIAASDRCFISMHGGDLFLHWGNKQKALHPLDKII